MIDEPVLDLIREGGSYAVVMVAFYLMVKYVLATFATREKVIEELRARYVQDVKTVHDQYAKEMQREREECRDTILAEQRVHRETVEKITDRHEKSLANISASVGHLASEIRSLSRHMGHRSDDEP